MALAVTLVIERLAVGDNCHWVDAGASTLPVSVMRVVGMLEPTRLPMISEGTMESGKVMVVSGELVEDLVVWSVSMMAYAHPIRSSQW